MLSAAVIYSIPAGAIDHERARGFVSGQRDEDEQGLWTLLKSNRPLLLLSLIAAIFHFAHASMLPLAGQKLGLANPGLESTLVSACILTGQLVAIPVAMVVGRNVGWGLKPLLAVSCLALAVRGVTFALFNNLYLQVGAQLFEGVAMGIWDVLIPLILADLIIGSGRYSTSRGVLSTVQGVGGSLSNAAAGFMVMLGGYTTAFAGLTRTRFCRSYPTGLACVNCIC
jgi:hypothetical protein